MGMCVFCVHEMHYVTGVCVIRLHALSNLAKCNLVFNNELHINVGTKRHPHLQVVCNDTESSRINSSLYVCVHACVYVFCAFASPHVRYIAESNQSQNTTRVIHVRKQQETDDRARSLLKAPLGIDTHHRCYSK